MRKTLALSLLAVLTHAAAFAQFGETVEVRVTNVDAIVTDKKGDPVFGLTKDDFEVYEDGVRQEITHFAEIVHTRGEAGQGDTPTPPAASPQGDIRRRLITVLVDLASLEPANRATVLPQLQEFLTTNMRPGDAAAIYSWGDSLTVELQPTSDPAAIAAAIQKIAAYPKDRTDWWRQELELKLERVLYLGTSHRDEPPTLDEGLEVTHQAAARGIAEMRQKAEAIKSILATLRGEPGRKALLLLTQSLSTNPADEAFYYLSQFKDRFKHGVTLNRVTEARKYEVPGLASDVAAAANNAGVTLYPLHTAGKFSDWTFNDATKGGPIRTRPVTQFDARLISLSALSDETGGRAIAGSGNWKNAFDIVSNELNAYYSIGYSARGDREDRTMNIEVRLRNKAHVVRTRKTIVEQTAATAMKDMVAANLFQTRATNDLAVKAGIGTATPAGENLVHPVTITIPTSTLTLTPDGTDLAGKFLVFAAFLRSDGAVSAVGPQVQQFRFPAASLARRKEVTVKLDVTGEKGVDAISLGVMDEASSATGFALIDVPPAQ
jgi:VWFA-related protein